MNVRSMIFCAVENLIHVGLDEVESDSLNGVAESIDRTRVVRDQVLTELGRPRVEEGGHRRGREIPTEKGEEGVVEGGGEKRPEGTNEEGRRGSVS